MSDENNNPPKTAPASAKVVKGAKAAKPAVKTPAGKEAENTPAPAPTKETPATDPTDWVDDALGNFGWKF